MKRQLALTLTLAAALVSAAVLVACGGATDRSEPIGPGTGGTVSNVDPDAAAHVQLVGLLSELASSVEGEAGNCDGFATQVNGWVTTHYQRVNLLANKMAQSDLGSDTERIESQLLNSFDVVLAAAGNCKENDVAWAAFGRFDQLVDKP